MYKQEQKVIDLDSSFDLLKDLPSVIVQPEEMMRLTLSQYFRGQLLDYKLSIWDEIANKQIKDDEVFQLNSHIVQSHLVDFDQKKQERSLPQTSLLMTDQYNNKFLIFIDFYMYLNIYNMTNYYLEDTSQAIKLVTRKSLYSSDYNIDSSKECNNLIALDKQLLFAICKSNVKAQSPISVGLWINITNIRQPKVQYQSTGFNFEALRDGALYLFKNSEIQSQLDDSYLIWVKENITNCHFNLYQLTNSSLEQVLQISSFNGTKNITFKITMSYPPNSQTLTDSIESNAQNRKIKNKGMLKQGSYSSYCKKPMFIEFDADYLEFLQIKDILVIDFYQNIIVASDYNYGLLFWEVQCNKTENGQVQCQQRVISRVKYEKLGQIDILAVDNYKNEKILIVQVINPPQIIEVNIDVIQSPYVSKIYAIREDEDMYYSMGLIAVNSEHILMNFIQTMTFKSVIRIYKRDSTYFTSAISQITFQDFIDSGMFLTFIKTNDNSFLIKTSDLFMVYRIQPVELIIKALNSTQISQRGYYDMNLTLKLTVTNYSTGEMDIFTHNRQMIDTQFDLVFLRPEETYTLRLYYGDRKNIGQRVMADYSCGENSFSLQIDQYYSWLFYDLQLKQEVVYENGVIDQKSDYFKINIPQMTYQSSTNFTVDKCFLNQIFSQSDGSSDLSKKLYLICSVYNGSQIILVDFMYNSEYAKDRIRIAFDIPSQTIVEQQYASTTRQLFILSNKSIDFEDAAIFHIFKIYNIISWDYSINLNKEFSYLRDFRFREKDALTYYDSFKLGCIISKPIYSEDIVYQLIVVFELSESETKAKFKIRNYLNITFPLETNKNKQQILVARMKITSWGQIWILLNNNTLYIYEQIHLVNSNNNPDSNGSYLLKLYKQTVITNSSNTKVHNFEIYENLMITCIDNNILSIFRFDYTLMNLDKKMDLPLFLRQEEDYSEEYFFVISSITNKVAATNYKSLVIVIFERRIDNQFFGYMIHAYDINEPRHSCLIFKYQLQDDIKVDRDYLHIQYFVQNPSQLTITILSENQMIHFFTLTYNTEIQLDN